MFVFEKILETKSLMILTDVLRKRPLDVVFLRKKLKNLDEDISRLKIAWTQSSQAMENA